MAEYINKEDIEEVKQKSNINRYSDTLYWISIIFMILYGIYKTFTLEISKEWAIITVFTSIFILTALQRAYRLALKQRP